MDFYHSWLYVHILNASWFLWTMVILIFGANILFPILVWATFSSVSWTKFKKKKKEEKKSV